MPRVIISGVGIAGNVLAYWLGKHGSQVVVIERSLSDNQCGQIIDVEGPAQAIMKKMGVMEEIKSKVTHGAGIRFFDDSDQNFAIIPVGTTGVSNEIEIMRPALMKILLGAASSFPNVEFRIIAPSRAYNKLNPKSSSTSKKEGKKPIFKKNLICSSLVMVCVHRLGIRSYPYPSADLA